jgi:hypothetical protein
MNVYRALRSINHSYLFFWLWRFHIWFFTRSTDYSKRP